MTLFVSAVLAAYTSFMTYTLLMYMSTYLQQALHYPLESALLITALIGLIESLAAPLCAYLSDRLGRLKIMCLGAAGMAVLAVPLFGLLQTDSLLVVISSLSLLALCLACFDGPMMAYVLDQFNVNQRYSGLGFSYNLGVGILGGAAPLLLTWLIAKTQNNLMPGYFMSGLALFTLGTLGVFTLRNVTVYKASIQSTS